MADTKSSMSSRIGVVSDIHCQYEALAAAISAMEPIDQLICLGDCIDQARFCNRTVRLLRDSRAQVLLGNHEETFFTGIARASPSVDEELADWLASRPTRIEMVEGGVRMLAVHSTPWDSGHAYVVPGNPQMPRFAEGPHDIVLYGHTHQPLVHRIGQTLVVNPGSVGEGRPGSAGFVRSCAVVNLRACTAAIIDLD